MEVHHKSHHPRSIKEYLTEFVMLFAAVTLGFFVENAREHMVENERGIVYAKRLLDDLKEDSTRMDRVYNSAGEKIGLINSIMPMMADAKSMHQAIDSFFYFGFWSYNKYGSISYMPKFYRVEETMEELKAGNLRLIKSDSIVVHLSAYSRRYNILKEVVDGAWDERSTNIMKLHSKMFDKTYYLYHDHDEPRTFPIVYKDISVENVYTMKTDLLGFRINMEALQSNIKELRGINAKLVRDLREYIQE